MVSNIERCGIRGGDISKSPEPWKEDEAEEDHQTSSQLFLLLCSTCTMITNSSVSGFWDTTTTEKGTRDEEAFLPVALRGMDDEGFVRHPAIDTGNYPTTSRRRYAATYTTTYPTRIITSASQPTDCGAPKLHECHMQTCQRPACIRIIYSFLADMQTTWRLRKCGSSSEQTQKIRFRFWIKSGLCFRPTGEGRGGVPASTGTEKKLSYWILYTATREQPRATEARGTSGW